MRPEPMHSRASAAYRDAEAHSPATQIVLLLESAARHLKEARTAIHERRIEDRFNRVSKAHAIVGALQSCLDFEHGGEIAPMLDRLYGHILNRLMLINVRDDAGICDEVMVLLRRMGEGWAEIAAGEGRMPSATGTALLAGTVSA
jgi:flagellar protein FliS